MAMVTKYLSWTLGTASVPISATRGYNITKRFTYKQVFITKRKFSSFFLEFLKRILYCKFTLGNERLVIRKRLGYVITASGRIGMLCC